MKVDEFKAILAKGHIYRSLYHFTARGNLPSIATHGIVSKQRATETGIVISARGGNEWSRDADTLKGLNGYVNLCFTQSHPMCHLATLEGRMHDPVYLSIDPDVLFIDGVKITIGVANKSGVDLRDVEDGLGNLDTEVLYTHTDWHDPEIQQRLRAAEKCEILVPDLIAVGLIRTKI